MILHSAVWHVLFQTTSYWLDWKNYWSLSRRREKSARVVVEVRDLEESGLTLDNPVKKKLEK